VSEEADDCSLAKKNPNDLGNVGPERLHNSDLAPLLHGHSDECAHDSECRDDHDEEQEEKTSPCARAAPLRELTVHVDPGLRIFGRLEDCWIACFTRSALYGLSVLTVTPCNASPGRIILADINRHEKKFRVVQVVTGFKDAGDGQFFRQDYIAQFVDCFFFFLPFALSSFLMEFRICPRFPGE